MADRINLVKPKLIPPLDEGFRPAVLANRAFERATSEVGVPLVIGLEREGGKLSRFETRVFPEGHPQSGTNFYYVERIVKFLLWQRGGHKVYIGGPRSIAEYLQSAYSPEGEQQFDYHFMGEQVYGQPFQIVSCAASEVPPAFEAGVNLQKVADVMPAALSFQDHIVVLPRLPSQVRAVGFGGVDPRHYFLFNRCADIGSD